MGTAAAIRLEVHGTVARVTIDRPEVRNAFDDAAAAELARTFDALATRDDVRVVVLAGAGDVFCAGGDLNWMRRVAEYDRAANLADATAFQAAFEAVDRCPKPVVARVQGAALGGGAGLVACCDVAIAAEGTVFGFPEVRLGLVPGVISPYVLRTIGPSHTRRLFLTGERFDAAEALHIGLVHQVVPGASLDAGVESVVAELRKSAPQGMAGAKALVRALLDADAAEAAALARDAITDARASSDGREGLTAFLEKRKPGWLA
ncbi:MAG: enoyl-CoA hydratase-related protein [Planctomycetota bacterium]|nr:enoyl-CoA hydratase-related protein [Planctomycetota bacterium]